MLFISVIIPVRNEAVHIEEVLDRLLEQEYDSDRFEILVMDGESTDLTREIVGRYAEKHPQVRLLNNPKRLSSAARNIGVQNAKGDVILLVDGHCIIDSRLILKEVNEAFANPDVACLGRPQPLELSHANSLQLAIAAARRSPIGHHPDSFIYADQPCFSPAMSVAVAYRKEVFEKVGGFDERFDAAEDCEFNYRVDQSGLKCYFTPKIAVRYVPRSTLSGLAQQLIRYGKGRVRLTRKHPETFSWKSFIPAVFLCGLGLGVLDCLLFLFTSLTGLGQVELLGGHSLNWFLGVTLSIFRGIIDFYLAILLLESLRIAIQKRRLFYLLYLPVVFVTIHVASGYGLLRELLFPQSRFR
ncbi:MAG: glycosyltransferase family 2 protein [Thermoguttaceae bacterium]